jgi:hemolysin activation/secretion protein
MTRPFEQAARLRLLGWRLGMGLVLAAPVMAQPADPVATASPKIQVQSYQVSGNTLLPAERIDTMLARHTGERSLDELQQAAQAVQSLYREAGFGAVVAFLPEQTPSGGRVAITVVEGKLAKVTVTGQKHFDEANIRASLPSLLEGQTPRVREIDAQIQLANENPAKDVEVLLQPGARLGEVEAQVQVKEQPLTRITLGLDDTGNETTGRLRANLGWQHAGLWRRDHVLGLQLQFAPEKPSAVAVASVNYRVPFYAAGMALDAYAAYSDVDGGTTATAAGPLQFAGQGRIAGARLSKYLMRMGEIDHRIVVGLDHRDYINDCSILGLPPGACGNAGESVSVQPAMVEYVVQQAGQRAWGASIGVQHNLQIGGGHASDRQFDAVRPGARPRYTLLRMGLFGGLTVAETWQLQARLIGQWSADALVPGEQFGIGGASSVRGYDERELSGDSGASASIELWGPDFAADAQLSGGTLRFVGFADAGWVRNRLGTPCRLGETACHLASVGAGLRHVGGRWQTRFDVAYALRAANRTGRNDTRTHVSVSYSF